jgi:Fur family transcriptional regulator, ferric uptake regulator
MTHHDVQTCLTDELQMDRVTVYRALEWLTQNGLAHKIAGDDRIWRFRVNAEDHSHQHAHFRCTRCTRLICLDTPETVYNPDSSHSLPLLAPFPLPPGYQSHSFELTVHGLCNECV